MTSDRVHIPLSLWSSGLLRAKSVAAMGRSRGRWVDNVLSKLRRWRLQCLPSEFTVTRVPQGVTHVKTVLLRTRTSRRGGEGGFLKPTGFQRSGQPHGLFQGKKRLSPGFSTSLMISLFVGISTKPNVQSQMATASTRPQSLSGMAGPWRGPSSLRLVRLSLVDAYWGLVSSSLGGPFT